MKKAHEVTLTRWSRFTPYTVSTGIAARMQDVHWMQKKHDINNRYKLRITIRVEIVEVKP